VLGCEEKSGRRLFHPRFGPGPVRIVGSAAVETFETAAYPDFKSPIVAFVATHHWFSAGFSQWH
jgi:hypothetical protein